MLKRLSLNFKLINDFRRTFSKKSAFTILYGIINKKESIKVKSKNVNIHLRKNTKDEETFLEIFSDLMYDIPLSFTPKTIIDGGANTGFASMFFKLKFPDSEIAAVEIEDENLNCLRKNLASFSDIHVYKKGLSNKIANFKIEDPYNANNSFIIKEVNSDEDYDVQSITVDKIMEDRDWSHVDILKIDIEGSEKDLFSSNFEAWLPKTKVIYIETHDRMIKGCSAAVTSAINKYKEFILYTTTTGTLVYFNTNLMDI